MHKNPWHQSIILITFSSREVVVMTYYAQEID